MKANEVLKILRITRPTLSKYVKEGIIKVIVLPNGRYDYLSESVYAFLNKDVQRKTVIYARVSTSKQKKDLQNQIDLLKNYAVMNGFQIAEIYQDIASGISFEKRFEFFEMLDAILNGQIATVLITYKDRLSRVGFELFNHLFQQFGCKIIVISEVGSPQLDSQEVFEEIVSLLHCYSMKLYSAKKRKKIQELIAEEVSDLPS
jgi:predicted site-specific integrase-resolvase